MKICYGTGSNHSGVDYPWYTCELGINCTQESAKGARWACHGLNQITFAPGVTCTCTSDVCFRCWPASALPATALGGPATHTDVGSAGSGDNNSELTDIPPDCTLAMQTLTQQLAKTGTLERKVAELEATVAQVTESAKEKHNALEKQKQELQAQLDRQNGIGIKDLSPDELTTLYGESLSTAITVASTLKVEDARKTLAEEHNDFLCPIAHAFMLDPVVASDTHTYERSEITKWFSTCENNGKNLTSPKTNAPLENKTLISNHTLKRAMDTCLENTVQRLVLQDIKEKMSGHKRARKS